MEFLKHLVIVAIELNDLELCEEQFKQVTTAARVLQSDLYLSEAQDVHREMTIKWPGERRVKALEDLLN
jgi:hypothetical protein